MITQTKSSRPSSVRRRGFGIALEGGQAPAALAGGRCRVGDCVVGHRPMVPLPVA